MFSCDKLVGIMESMINRGEMQGKKGKRETEECGRNIAAVVQ